MKLGVALILLFACPIVLSQDTKTIACSPTIEALESKGDINIVNSCGIDEKQIRLEFEKFRSTQRSSQKDIKLSLKKVAQLFNEYQKINTERLDIIQQGIADGNSKLDKLLASQPGHRPAPREINKDAFQEAVRRQDRDDLELILTTIPSLTLFTAGDTIARLIHDSEINLGCQDLVRVLSELDKLGGISFYGGNFVISVLDRVNPPFHQNCYSEVGAYVSIFERDYVIQRLHSRKTQRK